MFMVLSSWPSLSDFIQFHMMNVEQCQVAADLKKANRLTSALGDISFLLYITDGYRRSVGQRHRAVLKTVSAC